MQYKKNLEKKHSGCTNVLRGYTLLSKGDLSQHTAKHKKMPVFVPTRDCRTISLLYVGGSALNTVFRPEAADPKILFGIELTALYFCLAEHDWLSLDQLIY